MFAGIAGGILMLMLHAVQYLVWGAGHGDFLDAVQKTSSVRRVATLSAAGVLVGVA